eukprot:TRINITY_DN66818_c2_g1_i1.p1 TRINITY_DN66818_c2_g1~~TRINITY_DN66818_c2_g1_i1.p1  ORF type:complete len:358 (-),score=23.63 TRINITY_DN66818_c2_g1_i1:106-1179(-)
MSDGGFDQELPFLQSMNSVCRDFLRGQCGRVYCRFMHRLEICRDFSLGKCSRGEDCKFYHQGQYDPRLAPPGYDYRDINNYMGQFSGGGWQHFWNPELYYAHAAGRGRGGYPGAPMPTTPPPLRGRAPSCSDSSSCGSNDEEDEEEEEETSDDDSSSSSVTNHQTSTTTHTSTTAHPPRPQGHLQKPQPKRHHSHPLPTSKKTSPARSQPHQHQEEVAQTNPSMPKYGSTSTHKTSPRKTGKWVPAYLAQQQQPSPPRTPPGQKTATHHKGATPSPQRHNKTSPSQQHSGHKNSPKNNHRSPSQNTSQNNSPSSSSSLSKKKPAALHLRPPSKTGKYVPPSKRWVMRTPELVETAEG